MEHKPQLLIKLWEKSQGCSFEEAADAERQATMGRCLKRAAEAVLPDAAFTEEISYSGKSLF
jgi:hypothetical protein